MSNLNKVQLIGRLTRDPELKYTQTGTALCKMGLATNHFTKKDGESKEVPDFHNLVCFDSEYRKLATLAAEYLKKGSLAYVEGRLQTRKWEAEDGSTRYATEVVLSDIQFLSPKSETSKPQPMEDEETYAPAPAKVTKDEPVADEGIDPDDIPF